MDPDGTKYLGFISTGKEIKTNLNAILLRVNYALAKIKRLNLPM
jgi:hypothetical protein